MSLEIRKYGNSCLRAAAVPVQAVTDEIRQLAREMLAAMYASKGVGLAAEQVGRTEALCVIDVPAEQQRAGVEAPEPPLVPMPLVLVNPRVIEAEGTEVAQEGCLSFPEIYADIRRARRVKAVYMDLDGNTATVEAWGLLSRAIQHEVDHLNGVLLVDRMTPVQRVSLAGRLKRLKRDRE